MHIEGSTTDEALRNAVEAVRLWAEDAIADGEALPQPDPSRHCAPIRELQRRSPKVPLS
jgi:predicted RNase H-like HicB family nuclease